MIRPRHLDFNTVRNPERFLADWRGFYERALNERTAVTRTHRARVGIGYGPHPSQILNVIMPRSIADGAPVLLFFHGGNWREGHPDYYDFLGGAWADLGVIFVSAGYRLGPQFDIRASIQDAALAANWVVDHAGELGGDASRVSIAGHSAGAYLAGMCALTSGVTGEAGGTIDFASLIFLSGVVLPPGCDLLSDLDLAHRVERHPKNTLMSYGIPELNAIDSDPAEFEMVTAELDVALAARDAPRRTLRMPDTDHCESALRFGDPSSDLFAASRQLVVGAEHG